MPHAAQPLRAVLATSARAARQRLGLTQEEAAARLRAHGLSTWIRGTVAQAEVGDRRFSLEEVLLMALAYDTTPAQLLTGADTQLVELSPDARLPLQAVRALLSGDEAAIHRLDPQAVDVPVRRSKPPVPRSERFPDVLAEARRFGIRRRADADRAVAGISDAERHAARKIGLAPEQVNFAAVARWGRTLAEERDHRLREQAQEVTPRGLQALRGHVTRELITELSEVLRKGST
jgi:transcriptional regulator with XRE-family HTH domain